MNHLECLKALHQHGASRSSVRLAGAFLTGRQMRVRIGRTLSTALDVSGGSPQGSILGNFVPGPPPPRSVERTGINHWDQPGDEESGVGGSGERTEPGPPPPRTAESAVADHRERSVAEESEVAPTLTESPDSERQPTGVGFDGRISSTPRLSHSQNSQSDGSQPEDVEQSFRFFRFRARRIFDDSSDDEPVQSVIESNMGDLPRGWRDEDLMLIKYIDDFNGVEKLYKNSAIRTYSQCKTISEVRALKSQVLYNEVKKKASTIGMKVN